jgi:Tfp pilus assembly protein PilZ
MRPVQQHPRHRLSVSVGLVAASGDVQLLRTDDLSLGGVYIRTRKPAPPGSLVRLRLPVAGSPHGLPLLGRVVHVIDERSAITKARPPGMGVQFDGLAPDAEAALRGLVDTLLAEKKRRHARADRPTPPVLRNVLAAARGMHDRIQRGDLYGAIGLATSATADDVAERTDAILRIFTRLHADANDAQRVELDEAAQAVRALEADLLALTRRR